MEIDSRLFFLICITYGSAFLGLGLQALEESELSDSVPPAVMFLLKHAGTVLVSHSSFYAFPPKLLNLLFLRDFMLLVVVAMFSYYGLIAWLILNFCALIPKIMEEEKFIVTVTVLIDVFVVVVFYFISLENSKNSHPVFAGLFTSKLMDKYFKREERWKNRIPQCSQEIENPLILKRRIRNKRVMKLIEFALGMVGTILFQNYFRLTSFRHVVAFLYLAVGWLANLAVLRASRDFGVFNFLLGNVIVGCTVSQYGLRGTTWIAYGASVALYALRLKLESMSLDEGKIILW